MLRRKEELVKLALEVGALKARVEALERKEWEHKPYETEEKKDPVTELFNKQFAEGLTNLLSYDGGVKNEEK